MKRIRANIDWSKLRILHSQGLSAKKIAKELGCSSHGVLYVLKKLRLPSNTPQRVIDIDMLKKLLSQGLTDDRIAEIMQFSRPAITYARYRHKLPCNRKPHQKTRIVDYPTLVRLHGEGLTDRQIAERMGLSYKQVMKARRRRDLLVNDSKKRRYTEEEYRYMVSLRRQGLLISEIASKVNRTYKAVREALSRASKKGIM